MKDATTGLSFKTIRVGWIYGNQTKMLSITRPKGNLADTARPVFILEPQPFEEPSNE